MSDIYATGLEIDAANYTPLSPLSFFTPANDPDGYIQIKDRSKDIIISGGENISSIEVEDVLYRHPAVLEAAVVAKSDQKWGETPCAFVALKPTAQASNDDIIGFCRDNLAHFKVPRYVIFGELPKTSTGKVQKFVLRQRAEQI